MSSRFFPHKVILTDAVLSLDEDSVLSTNEVRTGWLTLPVMLRSCGLVFFEHGNAYGLSSRWNVINRCNLRAVPISGLQNALLAAPLLSVWELIISIDHLFPDLFPDLGTDLGTGSPSTPSLLIKDELHTAAEPEVSVRFGVNGFQMHLVTYSISVKGLELNFKTQPNYFLNYLFT